MYLLIYLNLQGILSEVDDSWTDEPQASGMIKIVNHSKRVLQIAYEHGWHIGGYADQIDHPLPVQFTALLPIRLTTPLFCS